MCCGVSAMRHCLRLPPDNAQVELYYEHSREMTAMLAARPCLAREAAAVVNALVDDLRVRGRVSAQTRDGGTALVHALVPLASPHLRGDIERTLREGLSALLEPLSDVGSVDGQNGGASPALRLAH